MKEKKIRWFLCSFLLLCAQSGWSTQTDSLSKANKPSLHTSMEEAWKITWNSFFHPKTSMFYDYLSSYVPGKGLQHLPRKEEVRKQFPNVQGYDTGMEDCMISAGVMLEMIIDKHAVTADKTLKQSAYAVFKGIQNSTTSPGIEGFVARCVCVEDGKSIYISSSRDQYTHAVYGLWLYYFSPLADKAIQAEVAEVISSIADRATKFVTPENDYDFSRADGSRDTRGISRMWKVDAHEAARLPMIYAAAWATTKQEKYHELYMKYSEEGIVQSKETSDRITTYALMQTGSSLHLLEKYERSSKLREEIAKIQINLAQVSQSRARNANKKAQTLDLTRVGSDWRSDEGLRPSGEYRKVWYCIRESGEAALTQLMLSPALFSQEQKDLLTDMITRLNYKKVSSNGIFYLQGAYWKARRLGIYQATD